MRKDNKKYLVIPGFVISHTDGEIHFITADKLIKLYNVPRDECVIGYGMNRHTIVAKDLANLKILRPKNNGEEFRYSQAVGDGTLMFWIGDRHRDHPHGRRR